MTDYLLKIKGVVCDAAIFHSYGEAMRTAADIAKSRNNEYAFGDIEVVRASEHYGSNGAAGD